MIFALLIIAGCSPRAIVTVQDDLDFPVGNYGSYSWKGFVPPAEDKMHTYYSPLTDSRLRESVDIVMKSKGYRMVRNGAALQLHYHIIIEDKSVEPTESYDYESSTYWFRSEFDPYYYTQGTLIIDIVDTRSGCLIWRARAVGALDDLRAEQLERCIDRVVSKMLKALPDSRGAKLRDSGSHIVMN